MPLQARAGQEGRARLSREEVRQAPRGRWKPGTAARPDTAVWNGAGFWQSGGCRRVTTATPEWLGWVERPMEAATRDAASVCFASASRAGGSDRIQRNRRADAVACWWRIGSTGRSRIAHMESRYQSGKQKAVGGTCGNAPRFTDGDAAGLCAAVPPVRQGGPAIAVRGRYPCTNERRWAWKAASALAVTGPPPLLRGWRRAAIKSHSRGAAIRKCVNRQLSILCTSSSQR